MVRLPTVGPVQVTGVEATGGLGRQSANAALPIPIVNAKTLQPNQRLRLARAKPPNSTTGNTPENTT